MAATDPRRTTIMIVLPLIAALIAVLATWGDEAAAAAAEAGEESPPPNDYFIRNVNPLLRTFAVRAGTRARLTTDTAEVRPSGFTVSLAEWMARFEASPALQQVPYWIEVDNDAVTAIEEQFLP